MKDKKTNGALARTNFDYDREMRYARLRCGLLCVFCTPLSAYVSMKIAKMKRHWKLGDVETAIQCARQIRKCGFLMVLTVYAALIGVVVALVAVLTALA